MKMKKEPTWEAPDKCVYIESTVSVQESVISKSFN